MDDLVQKVRNAGVVGAGGAGFPAYVKMSCEAELLIANGAECEPLLYKDQTIIQQFSESLIQGMLLLMHHIGAKRGVLAVKEKHKASISHIEPLLPENIDLKLMPNMYPAGDEYELVYEVTGKRIPAGGLPKEIGVLVNNVETIVNISRASEGKPVTHSMITVHGEVETPFTAWLPVGMTYSDILALAGKVTCDNPVIIEGGAMMGSVETDLSKSISAVSSALLVLPADAHLLGKRAEPESAFRRIGKSACDQCSLCTEMCPRYLLGYPIRPHLVMRSLLTSGITSETLSVNAQACCECNVCTLWACPEHLNPRDVCATTKRDLRAAGLWQTPEQLQAQTRPVHSMRDYRAVPTKRLIQRLGLAKYDKRIARWKGESIVPESVSIALSARMGADTEPVVKVGDTVDAGSIIATVAADKMGVPVHASISGTVTSVSDHINIQSSGNRP
ncbi:MAG: NADH dehydrogenase subunit [Gammaproteobacteria bacterium]|nr:MAG: NADH dehydrogenase subunit [Pseudomonadota bacterium]PIE37949.1 MAG: NADH dehydrogenase subunit [Gammaproteobacteria bacterium]